MFLEHYFDRYTFQPEKGLAYGFEKREACYDVPVSQSYPTLFS